MKNLPTEFPVLVREYHNGMYRVSTYYLSKVAAFVSQKNYYLIVFSFFAYIRFSQVPTYTFDGIVFVSIAYFMVGKSTKVTDWPLRKFHIRLDYFLFAFQDLSGLLMLSFGRFYSALYSNKHPALLVLCYQPYRHRSRLLSQSVVPFWHWLNWLEDYLLTSGDYTGWSHLNFLFIRMLIYI